MTWPELRRLGGAPWAADVLIVGGTAALQALTLALARPENWPPAIVVAVLQTAPLLLRRRWPLPVLAALVAAGFAQSLVHVHFAGYLIAIPAAVYSVADRSGPLRWLVLAAGLLYAAGSAVQGLVDTHDVLGLEDAFPGVVVCAAFIIGLNARTRRAYAMP